MKPGPEPYEDETGDRSETRLPLIPVTPGEYEAIMSVARVNGRSYADWAREVLKRAARGLGAQFPKQTKRQKTQK